MQDKQIEKLIKAEEKRQKKVINLIPSENYVSKDVLDTLSEFRANIYRTDLLGTIIMKSDGQNVSFSFSK